MHRSKSSISLRNLANSLKHSIESDQHKTHKKQFIPLRNSTSTINLINPNQPQKIYKTKNDYLLLMQTRKSRFLAADATTRSNNLTLIPTNKASSLQTLQNRKQKLLGMIQNYKQKNTYQTTALPGTQHSKPMYNNILNLLYEQQDHLLKSLRQSQQKFNLKNYNQYLTQIDKLSNQLNQIIKKQFQLKQRQNQTKNRLQFLQEQIISIEMNFNQRLAQKQYCEEFLDKYRSEYQYKKQAELVLLMFQYEYENLKLDKENKDLSEQLVLVERQFKEWKCQQNIQLKQKRFQNQLKQSRIQLMKIQQDLDHITQELLQKQKSYCSNQSPTSNPIRKIRQYICSYFKRYNQLNINHISHGQIADGIDIFLCKDGLISDFTKFIKQKTQKICLINGLYSLKLTQYLDCLKRIQNMFVNQNNQVNKVLANKFKEKIIQIKQQISSTTTKKQKNQQKILQIKQKIQKNLAQESLSLIELLNKNQLSQYKTNKVDGFINISQIKYKIKELKSEQVKRVKRIKEVFGRLKSIQAKESQQNRTNDVQQALIKQKQKLKNQIQILQSKVTQIQQIKKGYEQKKTKYDKIIEQGIVKMKQKDQIETMIKTISKEIQTLRKQKVQSIQKRFNYNNLPSQSNQQRYKHIQKSKIKEFNRLLDFSQTHKTQKGDNQYSNTVNLLSRFNQEDARQKQSCNGRQVKTVYQRPNFNRQSAIPRLQPTKRFEFHQQQIQEKQYEIQQKLERNTQASPRGLKQIKSFTLSNLNNKTKTIQNIFGSKSNLIQSKTIKPTNSQLLKKSFSTLNLKKNNENQNEIVYYQDLVQKQYQSKRESLSKKPNSNAKISNSANQRNKSKNLNKNTSHQVYKMTKQNIVPLRQINHSRGPSNHSRVPSNHSIKQTVNHKILSGRNGSSKKLSLQGSKNTSQCKKPVKKINQNNILLPKKDINSIISSKLLRR